MTPEINARRLLGIARAKVKMWEYDVPLADHIKVESPPSDLYDLAAGSIGDMVEFLIPDGMTSQLDRSELEVATRFASQFFYAINESQLDTIRHDFNTLMASTAYYLADLPGASAVLAGTIAVEDIDLEAASIDKLLLWLLPGNRTLSLRSITGPYQGRISECETNLSRYWLTGLGAEKALASISDLRDAVYAHGSPVELLLIVS